MNPQRVSLRFACPLIADPAIVHYRTERMKQLLKKERYNIMVFDNLFPPQTNRGRQVIYV
jgi:hypothetical protein